jgi:hypothetical protein
MVDEIDGQRAHRPAGERPRQLDEGGDGRLVHQRAGPAALHAPFDAQALGAGMDLRDVHVVDRAVIALQTLQCLGQRAAGQCRETDHAKVARCDAAGQPQRKRRLRPGVEHARALEQCLPAPQRDEVLSGRWRRAEILRAAQRGHVLEEQLDIAGGDAGLIHRPAIIPQRRQPSPA